VAVPRRLAAAAGCERVRAVGTVTDELEALAQGLLNLGVDTVAVESTGVYRIPVFELLEQHRPKVWLVDARQLKYVPRAQERRAGLPVAAEVDEPGAAARGVAPERRGPCAACGGAPARDAARRAGQLGAAHAEGAGADEHPAHRGAQRRDGTDRARHRARYRGRCARPAAAGPASPAARQGQQGGDRPGAGRQLARRAPVGVEAGAGDVRRHRSSPGRVRRPARCAAGRKQRGQRWRSASCRALAARLGRSSTSASDWPTEQAWPTRAATAWG